MDQETMRKRGWSIHSSDQGECDGGEHPNATGRSDRKVSDAHSDDSKPLTEKEKLALLESFPTQSVEENEQAHHPAITTQTERGEGKGNANGQIGQDHVVEIQDDAGGDSDDDFSTGDAGDEAQDRGDGENTDDYVAMFGSDDDPDDDDEGKEAPRKRMRTSTGGVAVDSTSVHTMADEVPHQKNQELELAKGRLSKWAARLFDPDRPRGLIEPPKTIPLNDEFLTAFGKREKDFDEQTGRVTEIDRGGLDVEEGEGEADDGDSEELAAVGTELELGGEGCKVKITNLAYTTSQATLAAACEKFGPLVEVNLIMDKEKSGLNTGRAYVTFEQPDDANQCIESMNDKVLDGRMLRVSLASNDPQRTRRQTSGQGGGPSRYWERDISSKCYRCGEVGHMEASCPNEAKPKPCPLCAQTGHDSWACPLKTTCFNCGVPGHVSRDCSQRRGMPRRLVCGACFQSGHHRWNCRERPHNVSSHDAKCMVCGKMGHFMCGEMRWFFGLEGISCFNCGQSGHHGMECERPGPDACARDGEVGLKEIETAGALSLVEEVTNQQKTRNGGGRTNADDRGRSRKRGRNEERSDWNRAKSQPPQGDYRRQYQTTHGRDSGRGYSPPPPPSRGYSIPPPNSGRDHRGRDNDRGGGRRPSDPRSRRGYSH